MTTRDSADHYGTVTRLLHWAMAVLLLWQIGGMVLKQILGRVPLMAFWVGTHASIGLLLLVLLLIRASWAFRQRRARPPYQRGLIGALAKAGHVALYTLMLVVPALAVLRAFGNGKPVQFFGMRLREATGEEIAWMVAPANMLHGTLAWGLAALILGHVAMALVHRFWWRDGMMARMIGRTV
ncbi:cytochrome b [Sphingomonas flavalba]|uniref:cytochrome b n=1 Tax=Sphingomonas flavalba TaxID=2559804 RepID=UPI0039E001F2